MNCSLPFDVRRCGPYVRSMSLRLRKCFGRASITAAVAFASVLVSETASAYEEDDAAVLSNKGLRLGFGPILLIPSDGGPMGGGLNFDLRYGIGLNPVIIAPGGRLSGYAISGRFVGTAMPTARVTLPFGPFAPFILGGVGGGWISNPSEGGVALLGGGGLMIHFGRHFAIGAEATYQTITSTELKSWAIGPAILISF